MARWIELCNPNFQVQFPAFHKKKEYKLDLLMPLAYNICVKAFSDTIIKYLQKMFILGKHSYLGSFFSANTKKQITLQKNCNSKKFNFDFICTRTNIVSM